MSVDTHKFGMAHKGTSVVLYRSPDVRRHQFTQVIRGAGLAGLKGVDGQTLCQLDPCGAKFRASGNAVLECQHQHGLVMGVV